MSMWCCPLCSEALLADGERSLVCPSGHRFDYAREGYVNLLPANRKRTKEPGDSPEMIAARCRVHDEHLYRPLAESIVDQVASTGWSTGAVLDLGCGEAYYSSAVSNAFPESELYGVDIAKSAMRQAARRCKAGNFAVASAFDVPLPDDSLDLVLSIFAPVDEVELRRLLKPGGLYVKVVPAPRHLWELRCLLYREPRPHSEKVPLPHWFEVIDQRDLSYQQNLEGDLLRDLIAMTPYAHRGEREGRTRLDATAHLEVEMAFTVAVMRYRR